MEALHFRSALDVVGDSKLIIQWINGVWTPTLPKYHEQIRLIQNLLGDLVVQGRLSTSSYRTHPPCCRHVYRERNRADSLCNSAISAKDSFSSSSASLERLFKTGEV